MALFNTKSSYGSVAKFFHWTVSFFVICLLCVGFFMGDIGDKALRGNVYNVHKLIGLTVLCLMVLRTTWMLMNPKPGLDTSKFEKFIERSVHALFYTLLLLMPLSGWMMATAAGYLPHIGSWSFAMPGIVKSDDIKELAGIIHEVVAWTLLTLVVLHVAAALKHHFINKDSVLRRMLPKKRKEINP
jgi:cytochrome b561